MAHLELAGLAKRFPDGTQAVKFVSLTVQDGELLVVMGPSGCGKSTMLRLIAGLEEPTGGKVLLDGRDVTLTPPAQRDMAMVFQAYALYPHMTVAENLAVPLKMRHVARGERDTQVRAVAEQLRLTPLLDRRPKELSGGEQQRVALGRALIRRPKLFLLDEPLSNLDATLRAEVREEIRRLHADTGITMVYVTHDQQEAVALAQRLAVMRTGELLQLGTPDDLYASPATLDVARALGHPPVNVVTGTATTEGDVPALRTPAGTVPLPGWAAGVPLPSDVVFALRPEHVLLDQDEGAKGAVVDMVLTRVEGAGPDRVVWCAWGAARWAARPPNGVTLPATGDTIPVTLHVDAAHLFDAATGTSLRPPSA